MILINSDRGTNFISKNSYIISSRPYSFNVQLCLIISRANNGVIDRLLMMVR